MGSVEILSGRAKIVNCLQWVFTSRKIVKCSVGMANGRAKVLMGTGNFAAAKMGLLEPEGFIRLCDVSVRAGAKVVVGSLPTSNIQKIMGLLQN